MRTLAPPRPPANSADGRSTQPPRWLYGGILALLVVAPLVFGANRTWVWMPLWTVLFVWLGLCGLHPSVPRLLAQMNPWDRRIVALFAASGVFMALQFVGSEMGSSSLTTVDGGSTAREILLRLGYLGVFAGTLVLARSRRRLLVLAAVILLGGVFQALVGIAVHVGHIGWLFDPDGVRGTFINRNHFAGYLEMAILVGVGLVLSRRSRGSSVAANGRAMGQHAGKPTPREPDPDKSNSRDRRRSRQRRPQTRASEPTLSRLFGSSVWDVAVIAPMLGIVICSVGLAWSGSRAGPIALVGGLGTVLVTSLIAKRFVRSSNQRSMRGAIGVCAVLVLLVTWQGWDKLGDRLSSEGVETSRWSTYEAVSDAAMQAPWFGTGAGTFRWVYPQFKAEDAGGRLFEHAHNDYLELWLELGIVGATPIGLAVLGCLSLGVVALHRGVGRRSTGLAFGFTAACSALLLHSLVDFNLQIPANSLTFAVCLGGALNAYALADREFRADESSAS